MLALACLKLEIVFVVNCIICVNNISVTVGVELHHF